MNKLSIIIPVYNEKETIVEIIRRVEAVNLPMEKEIIVVDDFSDDGTRDILKNMEARYKILYHKKNCGKGRALRTGFAVATGNYLAIQDADLEYDPNDFKILLAKIMEPNVAVVYGSRTLHKNYWSLHRSSHIFAMGGFFLSWLTRLLYNVKITDEPTCYKMFTADLLPKLNLQCERFEFCPELTAKVAKMGIEIHEVPINYHPRRKNEGKKIGWQDGWEAILTLLKYRFKR